MSANSTINENSFQRYISGIRSVWSDVNDPELPFKVKALMEGLLAETKPDDRGWLS